MDVWILRNNQIHVFVEVLGIVRAKVHQIHNFSEKMHKSKKTRCTTILFEIFKYPYSVIKNKILNMFRGFKALFVLVAVLGLTNATSISYGFSGIDADQFDDIFHKFPVPSLAKVLQNMEPHTELILRPFNFGATQSYTDHSGLGKNTNVKGKSCYLNDDTLNGKITYIQNNAYTGRTQKEDKITYIGKYLARDRLALEALTAAAATHCAQWSTKQVDEIKEDIITQLTNSKSEDHDFDSAVDYINSRFIFKVNISGTTYLTTEFVTTYKVQSKTQLPVTTEICDEHHKCKYEVGTETTNVVEVLAYQTLNLDTCEFRPFELVADMDIMTIHFPHENTGDSVELNQYFNDATGKNCENSFKLAFGISPQITMVYDYIHKLMEATAEWGLIRHSIEALNFCFVQPYEAGDKYYIKLSKNILGNGEITMIKEDADTRIIPDTVRQWVMEGKCTPLNPSWIFLNEKEPKALMWTGEERDSILNSPQFLNNNCPTYDVIRMIQNDGASIPIASLKEGNLRVNHRKIHTIRRH